MIAKNDRAWPMHTHCCNGQAAASPCRKSVRRGPLFTTLGWTTSAGPAKMCAMNCHEFISQRIGTALVVPVGLALHQASSRPWLARLVFPTHAQTKQHRLEKGAGRTGRHPRTGERPGRSHRARSGEEGGETGKCLPVPSRAGRAGQPSINSRRRRRRRAAHPMEGDRWPAKWPPSVGAAAGWPAALGRGYRPRGSM